MAGSHIKVFAAPVLLALMLLGSARAHGTIFHVSPFGSNTPPFDTYAKAATDPRTAIDSASGYGDTVLIHTGAYTLDSEVQLPSGLDVFGIDRDSVSLVWNTSRRSGTMLFGHGDHVVSGITFVNAHGSSDIDANALAVALTSGGLTLSRCRFDWTRIRLLTSGRCEVFSTEFLAHAGYGILLSESGEAYVHGNFFWGGNNFSEGGYGIVVNGGGEIVIENNFLDWSGTGQHGLPLWIDNPSYGHVIIRSNVVLGGQAAIWWFYGNGTVENNLLSGPEDQSQYFGGDVFNLAREDTLSLRNNILLDITWDPLFSISCPSCFTGPIRYSHNAFWPPRDSFFVIPPIAQGRVLLSASDNFNAYPMFTPDTTFRLQFGSPLIDAGDPVILDPDGSRSDIGPKGGPWGSTYTYPDLAPAPPDSVQIVGQGLVTYLAWSQRPEHDLKEYRLYRGDFSGFWHTGLTPINTLPPSDTDAYDAIQGRAHNVFYVVTAVDSAGHESQPSPEAPYIFSGVDDNEGDAPLPRTPSIIRVYPNPFNAATTIELFIPDVGAMPAPVRITLYDVMGRLLSVPFDGELNPGNHPITISATDAQGYALASGVYFARLRVWGREFGRVKKLVVMK